MSRPEEILAAAGRGVIVSGKFNPKKQQVEDELDGDAAMSLHLLRLAGCEIGSPIFVHPGTKVGDLVRKYPGYLILDVGGVDGIKFYGDGSIVIDHHGASRAVTPCTARTLSDELGLTGSFKKTKGLKQALWFVHSADTNNLPQGAFGKSARTIVGLSRHFGPEQIITFFAKGNDLETVLSDSQLKKLGLTEVSKKQQAVVDTAFAAIDAAQKVETFSYSEGLKGVVVEGQVIGGSFAAYERGHEFFASFTPPSYAVNFPSPREEVVAVQKRLGEGKIIRGSMILCNETPTEHSLVSFLEAIEGTGNFRPCTCGSGYPVNSCPGPEPGKENYCG